MYIESVKSIWTVMYFDILPPDSFYFKNMWCNDDENLVHGV